MASPAVLGSRALRASRQPVRTAISNTRCLSSFQYETGDASGVKFASRDLPGSTTTLTVVSKAGTRFQPLPGYSDALEKFAYKSTAKRSSLRITREVELLEFLKDDLPYFAELLAEVISKTRYSTHELNEEVFHILNLERQNLLASPLYLALNSVHGVAFHRGLGEPLNPTSSVPITKYIDAQGIADFSDAAYARSNIAVVANGTTNAELSKWVKEFYGETGNGSAAVKITSQPSKYYGGEERIAHGKGNAYVIGFPGSASFTAGSSYKPEVSVLAALLGGESAIKWSPGFSLLSNAASEYPGAKVSTQHAAYSDSGLLYITITGKGTDVGKAAAASVQAIKKVASGEVKEEEIKKAIASARFRALEAGQQTEAGLEATGNGLINGGKALQIDELSKGIEGVTADKVKAAAKALLENKASVSAVGDLHALPFAEEIGLSV